MDSDGLPMIGSGVDYSQVGAIHQKRTLAFINYFVTSTVSFLNNFSRSCEIRLQKCESKIQKLEASIEILEAKLSSIPGLEEVTPIVTDATPIRPMEVIATNDIPPKVLPSDDEQVSCLIVQTEIPEVPSGMVMAKEDPTYKKFFRMLHVGVPEPAVRLKMKAEGLNPDVLSNPDLFIPATNDIVDPLEGTNLQDSSASETD